MITDPEFWATVINGSSNIIIAGAMVLQTVIFYVTFSWGRHYLSQHKQKMNIESNDRYAKLALETILEYELVLFRVFDPKYNYKDQDELQEIRKIMGEQQNDEEISVALKIGLPTWRYRRELAEITRLQVKFRFCSNLLNDPRVEEIGDLIFGWGAGVEHGYQIVRERLYPTGQPLKFENDVDEYKFKVLTANLLPKGMHDKDHDWIKHFYTSHRLLAVYLKKYIV
jgi:hypothetical protein